MDCVILYKSEYDHILILAALFCGKNVISSTNGEHDPIIYLAKGICTAFQQKL